MQRLANVTVIPDRGSSVGVLVGGGGGAINNLVFYAQSTSTVTSGRDILSRPLIKNLKCVRVKTGTCTDFKNILKR